MTKLKDKWGLILGGSSGIGLASAKKLALEGMNLIVIHRDRRGSMVEINAHFSDIRAHGVELVSFNQDALSEDARRDLVTKISDVLKTSKLTLMLHSIALGNLKPAAPPLGSPDSACLGELDLQQTIYNMGSSLLFWVQDLHRANLLADDTRILGLTSEGNRVTWDGYAAISAAKATLESLVRAIAKEFAPYGIRCNVLQAGLTDTKAFRLIPGCDELAKKALSKNPFGRLTTPEDVAAVVYLMTLKEAAWINGALLRVDGGEAISG
ncbi:MAG: SDR family oxidoreductase [Bdellovibrionota bacterium]|nr:MAG: SDR family oxidoreductase [Pseudomonadota bacterium]